MKRDQIWGMTKMVLEERLRLESPAGVLGNPGVETRSEHVEVGLRFADAQPALETRNDRDPIHPAKFLVPSFHRERYEDLRLAQERETEVRRHHADDRVGLPVERERTTERRGIRSHLASPEAVGEHRHARSARAQAERGACHR